MPEERDQFGAAVQKAFGRLARFVMARNIETLRRELINAELIDDNGRAPWKPDPGPSFKWSRGVPPLDKRVLLLGYPLEVSPAFSKDRVPVDLFVGHYDEGIPGFVVASVRGVPNKEPRTTYDIRWWAEVPYIPHGAELSAVTTTKPAAPSGDSR